MSVGKPLDELLCRKQVGFELSHLSTETVEEPQQLLVAVMERGRLLALVIHRLRSLKVPLFYPINPVSPLLRLDMNRGELNEQMHSTVNTLALSCTRPFSRFRPFLPLLFENRAHFSHVQIETAFGKRLRKP